MSEPCISLKHLLALVLITWATSGLKRSLLTRFIASPGLGGPEAPFNFAAIGLDCRWTSQEALNTSPVFHSSVIICHYWIPFSFAFSLTQFAFELVCCLSVLLCLLFLSTTQPVALRYRHSRENSVYRPKHNHMQSNHLETEHGSVVVLTSQSTHLLPYHQFILITCRLLFLIGHRSLVAVSAGELLPPHHNPSDPNLILGLLEFPF